MQSETGRRSIWSMKNYEFLGPKPSNKYETKTEKEAAEESLRLKMRSNQNAQLSVEEHMQTYK